MHDSFYAEQTHKLYLGRSSHFSDAITSLRFDYLKHWTGGDDKYVFRLKRNGKRGISKHEFSIAATLGLIKVPSFNRAFQKASHCLALSKGSVFPQDHTRRWRADAEQQRKLALGLWPTSPPRRASPGVSSPGLLTTMELLTQKFDFTKRKPSYFKNNW